MPKFVKFLKGILSNRRQKGVFETVALTENCSALLMANSPPKLQDPGSFSIPCKIGSELIPRAFCDLGASVSLFPYSICKKLGLQNIKLTTMALQLADHSSGAIIDVKSHKLSLEIGKEKIEFDLSDSSISNPSSQDNSSKINIHKVEECSVHESSPPASNKKYIFPARAKLKDVQSLHELAMSISWVWRRQRDRESER
ncbi:uncharacterized protein LOC122011281 [Zingiber officinale]|uniref:uncharacterized protein LOC122011281 n=1 Tax=Zingiber officinale TaxID=94328 RepID=UPI001C4B3A3A|nr:uncharacterized protein LOC122011281 [Zingiber officinale]